MKKIERYNNWCEIDRLDGVDIKDKERLRVKFPNGEILEITVSVFFSSYEISDMGTPYTIPCYKAYLETKWKGQECLVPLVELEAERVINENPVP